MEKRGQTWLKNLAESGSDAGDGEGTEAEMECSDKSAVTVPKEYKSRSLKKLGLIFLRLSCNFARIMRSENSRHGKVGGAKKETRYREAVETGKRRNLQDQYEATLFPKKRAKL